MTMPVINTSVLNTSVSTIQGLYGFGISIRVGVRIKVR